MLPKAVLFDLDDTIITEEKAGDMAWEQVCRLSARETGAYDGETFLRLINRARREFWDDPVNRIGATTNIYRARVGIVRRALKELNSDNESLAEKIVQRYAVLKIEKTEFVPYALETIHHLKQNDVKIAVLTNGDGREQRTRLEKFRLIELVHCCLIAGEMGFGKPDPRVYEMALCNLGVKNGDAWMVGDRLETDIRGARDAGIFAVWFDASRSGLPSAARVKPDRVINEIRELLVV